MELLKITSVLIFKILKIAVLRTGPQAAQPPAVRGLGKVRDIPPAGPLRGERRGAVT